MFNNRRFNKSGAVTYLAMTIGLTYITSAQAAYYQSSNPSPAWDGRSKGTVYYIPANYPTTPNYGNNEGFIGADNSNFDNRNNKGATNPIDQQLTKIIQDKLRSGWFANGYDRVKVQVNNGVVILSGPVRTREDREKVEKEVMNTRGVRSVNNLMTVDETAGTPQR